MYSVYTNYDVITDANGNVRERLSFDAWGNRRNPNNWSQTEAAATAHIFSRGFTGHEHLDYFGIINMNGRLYDPAIASFFSPDPYVQAPENTQGYNGYSYCFNNPLKYKDPSGEIVTIIDYAIFPYMTYTYTPNMFTLPQMSLFTQATINSLNAIYNTTAGMPVLTTLVNSSNLYNITSNYSGTFNAFSFTPFLSGGGGEIKAGGIQYQPANMATQNLAYATHLAYQYDMGKWDGGSVFNIMKAELFQKSVMKEITGYVGNKPGTNEISSSNTIKTEDMLSITGMTFSVAQSMLETTNLPPYTKSSSTSLLIANATLDAASIYKNYNNGTRGFEFKYEVGKAALPYAINFTFGSAAAAGAAPAIWTFDWTLKTLNTIYWELDAWGKNLPNRMFNF